MKDFFSTTNRIRHSTKREQRKHFDKTIPSAGWQQFVNRIISFFISLPFSFSFSDKGFFGSLARGGKKWQELLRGRQINCGLKTVSHCETKDKEIRRRRGLSREEIFAVSPRRLAGTGWREWYLLRVLRQYQGQRSLNAGKDFDSLQRCVSR